MNQRIIQINYMKIQYSANDKDHKYFFICEKKLSHSVRYTWLDAFEMEFSSILSVLFAFQCRFGRFSGSCSLQLSTPVPEVFGMSKAQAPQCPYRTGKDLNCLFIGIRHSHPTEFDLVDLTIFRDLTRILFDVPSICTAIYQSV